jgi:hypothetical protein
MFGSGSICSRPSAAVILAIASFASVGCTRSQMVEISGKVTLDGAPLSDGTIHFEPAEAPGPRAGAVIHDGAYKLRLLPGSKLVRIEGFIVTGERPFNPSDPNSAMIPTKESIVPDMYNGHSTLKCDVGAATNSQDFALVRQKS